MAVVTPIDRPKSGPQSLCNQSFGGVFVLSICFRIFCWYRGFCDTTESDFLLSLILLFLRLEDSKPNVYQLIFDFKLYENKTKTHVFVCDNKHSKARTFTSRMVKFQKDIL